MAVLHWIDTHSRLTWITSFFCPTLVTGLAAFYPHESLRYVSQHGACERRRAASVAGFRKNARILSRRSLTLSLSFVRLLACSSACAVFGAHWCTRRFAFNRWDRAKGRDETEAAWLNPCLVVCRIRTAKKLNRNWPGLVPTVRYNTRLCAAPRLLTRSTPPCCECVARHGLLTAMC